VIPVSPGLLRDGENVLAFSVHNASVTSSDLSFVPTLVAEVIDEISDGFRRGDADSSGVLEITDAIFVLDYLFVGGSEPACRDAADVDDTGTLDLSDAIALLNALFLGAVDRVAPPGFECGADPTEDAWVDCSTSDCR